MRRPKSEKIGEGFLSRPPGTGGAGSQGTGGAGSQGTGGAGSQVPPRGTNPPRQESVRYLFCFCHLILFSIYNIKIQYVYTKILREDAHK